MASTIAPITPYNGETHVRILQLDLDQSPSVAYFKLGHYEGEEPNQKWVEREERNTANLPSGITTLEEVVAAISEDLQLHS